MALGHPTPYLLSRLRFLEKSCISRLIFGSFARSSALSTIPSNFFTEIQLASGHQRKIKDFIRFSRYNSFFSNLHLPLKLRCFEISSVDGENDGAYKIGEGGAEVCLFVTERKKCRTAKYFITTRNYWVSAIAHKHDFNSVYLFQEKKK